MPKKCNPSRYAVISSGDRITYGFRCAKHHILTRRFSTREIREERLKEHVRDAKKGVL